MNFYEALKSASEQNHPLKVIKCGSESGAWGVELLAIRYAAWIKPEFEIEAAHSLITSASPQSEEVWNKQ